MRFDFGLKLHPAMTDEETGTVARGMAAAIASITALAVGNSFLVTTSTGNFRIFVERGEKRMPTLIEVYYENLKERRFDMHCTIEIKEDGHPIVSDWIGELASWRLTISMLEDIVNPNADWIQLETTPA